MQTQLIPTVRVAYTFPGGCWRPFWGFPNRTSNVYYETFHPSCPLEITFDLTENIFSHFVCSSQLVLKIWKVSDLYLYQVVQQCNDFES